MKFIDKDQVREKLAYEQCIPLMRTAMVSLSEGKVRHVMRTALRFGEGRLLGMMPGALGDNDYFGAKIIGHVPLTAGMAKASHLGVIVLFDKDNGDVACIVDATEVTAIRTAAASALATDVLARPDARSLAVLGTGQQALTHARAVSKVRQLSVINVWGRTSGRAQALARTLTEELGIPARAFDTAKDAVADADIICTVSASKTPILAGGWIRKGTHVNVVGSSFAGPTEVDTDLVVRSRYIADDKEHALKHGAEFLNAKSQGLVNDDHIVAEIGEVCAGRKPGRQSADEITLYKSLGHIVQDLAAARFLYEARSDEA